MPRHAQIEAILFWKAEPVSLADLAAWLNCSPEEISSALEELGQKLADRGLTLIRDERSATLGTNPAASDLIAQLTKEELSRDLGKAALETLSIVAYKGPITRAEIDYIRGVNSSFILRALQIRGLVERLPNPADARTYLYQPTLELWQYLGLTSPNDLPDREAVRAELTINSQN